MTLSVAIRRQFSSQFLVDLSFVVEPGVTIVFGESGSGKTTLLRSVAGLEKPDRGRIAIGERVLFDSSAGVNLGPADRRVGFVFQHLALFPHLSAAQNIQYGLAHLSAPERRERTLAIADSFRIRHLLDRLPRHVSGGERQRIGLARSLVTNPEILLLDEPLTALDYPSQSRIIDDLRQWNDEHCIPILYVTHSQREVYALGARVLVVQGGALLADGSPQDVLQMPSRDMVAALAGFENILDAVVRGRRVDAGVMVARLAGTEVDLETPLAPIEAGTALRIAIRAGDILLATEAPRGLSARNIVPGNVAAIVREGPRVRVTAHIGIPVDVHVTPEAAEELALVAGRSVWLIIKTHSCHPVSTL